jgi:ubiquinone/menaquinone biosynthesis C-methylase UbiE
VVERIVASDVSLMFLRTLAQRCGGVSDVLSLVACDANQAHFRPGSFDLVVGRSILHHLLDYDATLKQCHAMLKPGSAAVFFEPVLEGKTVITLLAALILRCDQEMKVKRLTWDDRTKIDSLIRHQTKSKRHAQDRAFLSRREDKHIFEIEKLCNMGRQVGFSSAEFLSNGQVNPTYWSYLVQTFTILGIPAEKIAPYRWIGEEFANTYGLMFRDKLVTPMGFFVFRKGA